MKKDCPIQIGNNTYLLRFNFDSICYIEDVTGKGMFQVLAEITAGTLKHLRVLLHAGLRKNHPDISIDQVGELIDDADELNGLVTSLLESINNYFSRSKADTKKN